MNGSYYSCGSPPSTIQWASLLSEDPQMDPVTTQRSRSVHGGHFYPRIHKWILLQSRRDWLGRLIQLFYPKIHEWIFYFPSTSSSLLIEDLSSIRRPTNGPCYITEFAATAGVHQLLSEGPRMGLVSNSRSNARQMGRVASIRRPTNGSCYSVNSTSTKVLGGASIRRPINGSC